LPCYEQISPGKWSEHFCLVNLTCQVGDEEEASAVAEADLHEASAIKSQAGLDSAFAVCLKKKGYVKVDGFRRAKD
jgi:hypothetical protein